MSFHLSTHFLIYQYLSWWSHILPDKSTEPSLHLSYLILCLLTVILSNNSLFDLPVLLFIYHFIFFLLTFLSSINLLFNLPIHSVFYQFTFRSNTSSLCLATLLLFYQLLSWSNYFWVYLLFDLPTILLIYHPRSWHPYTASLNIPTI